MGTLLFQEPQVRESKDDGIEEKSPMNQDQTDNMKDTPEQQEDDEITPENWPMKLGIKQTGLTIGISGESKSATNILKTLTSNKDLKLKILKFNEIGETLYHSKCKKVKLRVIPVIEREYKRKLSLPFIVDQCNVHVQLMSSSFAPIGGDFISSLTQGHMKTVLVMASGATRPKEDMQLFDKVFQLDLINGPPPIVDVLPLLEYILECT